MMQPVAKGFNFDSITLPTTMWLFLLPVSSLDPDKHRLKIAATPERHHNQSMIRFILKNFSLVQIYSLFTFRLRIISSAFVQNFLIFLDYAFGMIQ